MMQRCLVPVLFLGVACGSDKPAATPAPAAPAPVVVHAPPEEPRGVPAMVKALDTYATGKDDARVRQAAEGVIALCLADAPIDRPLADAVWNLFTRFEVAKATSATLVKDVHDAVVCVAASRKQDS